MTRWSSDFYNHTYAPLLPMSWPWSCLLLLSAICRFSKHRTVIRPLYNHPLFPSNYVATCIPSPLTPTTAACRVSLGVYASQLSFGVMSLAIRKGTRPVGTDYGTPNLLSIGRRSIFPLAMDISQVPQSSCMMFLNFTDNLSAMLSGGTVQETTQLNIESLWTGGPFQYSVRKPELNKLRGTDRFLELHW